ncbi:DUF7638 domain-containing protein [Paenibacillus sp. BAC0078]
MKAIRRTRTIEGASIPGIINNGGHYFYINVDVYEDGMTNCWELVDLQGLKSKLESTWLSPKVPVGNQLSIHGLGAYIVEEASWEFNEKSYYEHIEKTIRLLNPEFLNIYEISNQEYELQTARKVKHNSKSSDYYVAKELFYQTVEGNGFPIFMKYEGENYLVNVMVYKDGRVVIYNLPNEIESKLKEVSELFVNGTFFTAFDASMPIRIMDLGDVSLSQPVYSSEVEEKLKELYDIHKKLNGGKSTLEECRAAYYLYLENPNDFYRKNLKTKYELVPEHERMYLGDMDSKDWDYQRIIYRPNEKREV